MDVKPVGYCDLHEREVQEEEFERKGCWACYHFGYSTDYPYVDVQEAAQLLKRSMSTIRRWLKTGRLVGKLFIRERPEFQSGSPKKWFVSEEAIELMSKQQGQS